MKSSGKPKNKRENRHAKCTKSQNNRGAIKSAINDCKVTVEEKQLNSERGK